MSTKQRIGVAVDDWKVPIFERVLKQYGYEFSNAGSITAGVVILRVETTNREALQRVITEANAEAARTGKP